MSYADRIFKENCREILTHGVWDTDQNVRPHWEDGTPAHTVKKFGIINRYDLRQEFPILTIRRTYFKTCIDELLWIWQKKSNNIHDLRGHIWDSWADENGSIGKAYGYQLGVKHQYPEGAFDQVDRVLYDLKHNPASRRILTNIYNFQDLHEMALYPCAYSMTFNVSGHTLNAILNQRSQDMLAANNWNVVQYAVLVHMMAQVSGLEVGELVHVIADAHIYDRHVPIIEKLLEKDERPAPEFIIDRSVTDFYQFTRDSFSLEGYDPQPFEDKIRTDEIEAIHDAGDIRGKAAGKGGKAPQRGKPHSAGGSQDHSHHAGAHPSQKGVDPGVLHQAVQRRRDQQNDDKGGQHHPHRCHKGACQPRLRSADKGGHIHCQRAGRRL